MFAVSDRVPGCDNVELDGEFETSVFKGPYKDARTWHAKIKARVEEAGKSLQETWFFYTTCPRCVRSYGKNYVVGFARTR